MLFCFVMPVFASDSEDPKAADLVKDGQLIDLSSPSYAALFKELQVEHNFSRKELEKLFAGLTVKRRVLELMDMQWEAKPWYEYYPRFITSKVIQEGRENIKKYKKILDKVEAEFGVEREIVVAIWGIETQYGRHKGSFNMFQTLNTMFDAYPRRSKFYRGQLVHFLLLCRENNVDPLAITGSYGGAFGQTQFIPSSFREYSVDFDGDGKRDVWSSVPDILASIANYLHRYKWTFESPIYREIGNKLKSEKLTAAYEKGRKGLVPWQEVKEAQGVVMEPVPADGEVIIVGLELENGGMRYVAGYPNFQAITKWNHSNRYAMAVTELAARFEE
ncbi:MAG: lytic murein transglycosylase [Proteobacteria bacterium]|nr:lytic murein transglycosylase [Pseudomonadota bacterium]MBU1716611.1 lytic murein transglycosylase [Pseudomonadota bacterium]